jgi:hypothetical protein
MVRERARAKRYSCVGNHATTATSVEYNPRRSLASHMAGIFATPKQGEGLYASRLGKYLHIFHHG